MNREEILNILNGYSKEIEEMLPRFSKSHSGLHINRDDGNRFRVLVNEFIDLVNDHIPNAKHSARMIIDFYNQGVSNFTQSSSYASLEEVKGAVDALILRIERNPTFFVEGQDQIETSKTSGLYNGLNTVMERFHPVVMQLRKRHSNRNTLDVNDEYDVQDLFHSLLKLYFRDVRPEEWNPSYAGGSSRSDFLLPEINTIIEVKKTRQSMTDRDLGEQLIVDIAKYKQHPQCNSLICFVYDPDGRVSNPRGIENDLNDSDSDIDVRTIIVPKHE